MDTEHVIRASDSDREQAVEVLRGQHAEGRLTLEEFDERMSAAYAAKTWTDLRALTKDLPVRLKFGGPSAAGMPSDAERQPVQTWQRAWPLVPLVPVLLFWVIAGSIGAWAHGRGHVFPFFPVIPLMVFGTLFAWRRLRRNTSAG
jgi:hypothetical protein